MFLEGSPAGGVVDVISGHREPTPYAAPRGTLWSWPRSHRFTVRASPLLFTQLAETAERHAAAEICCHVHFYRDGEPLLQWFDAFDDHPLWVSKSIPRERVEVFCLAVGGTLSEVTP